MQFHLWCAQGGGALGPHTLETWTAVPAQLVIGIDQAAAAVPGHYASEERLAALLARLGKPRAAAFIEDKLPTTPNIRSGDLGEIFATEWIAARTTYRVAIKRLRWKDHRDMAMRGDDVIGIRLLGPGQPPQFLKSESKSRAQMATAVLDEARAGLEKDSGLPSAHALAFIADRLMDADEAELADALDDAQYRNGITPQQVEHLIFAFCGNAPTNLLTQFTRGYAGAFRQIAVGVHIQNHQDYIAAVYEKVIADANDD